VERQKAEVEKMLLSCFTKAQRDVIKQEDVTPIDINEKGVGTAEVSNPPPNTVSPLELNNMIGHFTTIIDNMIYEKLGKAVGKKPVDPSLVSFSNVEFNVSSAQSNTAAPPLYGMPPNFYENQPPPQPTPPMTSDPASSSVSGLAPQGQTLLMVSHMAQAPT
jgi:hypothetical protein